MVSSVDFSQKRRHSNCQTEEYDKCLGKLPGVVYACCGHDNKEIGGYIVFQNGVLLRFKELTVERNPQFMLKIKLRNYRRLFRFLVYVFGSNWYKWLKRRST